jgi:hypothetical protein
MTANLAEKDDVEIKINNVSIKNSNFDGKLKNFLKIFFYTYRFITKLKQILKYHNFYSLTISHFDLIED